MNEKIKIQSVTEITWHGKLLSETLMNLDQLQLCIIIICLLSAKRNFNPRFKVDVQTVTYLSSYAG